MQFLEVFFYLKQYLTRETLCKPMKILQFLKKLVLPMQAIGIRDVLYFGGMAMLGYGLWLLRPWIGFSVVGMLMLTTGYLMRESK